MLRASLCRRAACLSLVLASAGCTTEPDPGDYTVYRVAAASFTFSDGCFANDVPANTAEDSTTLRTNGTFMLLAGPSDSYYLDIGPQTLDGSRSDSSYAFSGQTVDVEYSCSDGTGSRTVSTTLTTVDFERDDAFVSGNMASATQLRCTGDECPEDTDCTVNGTFIGNEVLDVTLHQDVGAGDASPIPAPLAGQASGPDEPLVGTGGNCAPSCSHDECTVGGPLDTSCNTCALTVCATDPTCCADGGAWTTACITLADSACDTMGADHCPTFP